MLKQALVTFKICLLTKYRQICIPVFFNQLYLPVEVYQVIQNQNSKKAAVPGNIPIRFYKIAGEWIADFLRGYFNKYLVHGYFPNALKIAKVKPIFKSGKRSSMNNYRPISLLSSLAKVFEKLISKGLTKFLEDNILADQQLGFREGHFATHAITDFYSQICNNLDNGKHSCVLLLDLKKAFDTVNHEILLQKLDKHGIRGNSNRLFQSYLSNRFQFVCFNGIDSNKQKVTCGVPQGLMLGPTLFSLYVNDLPKFTEPSVRLFANDTIMIVSDNTIDKLNNTAK